MCEATMLLGNISGFSMTHYLRGMLLETKGLLENRFVSQKGRYEFQLSDQYFQTYTRFKMEACQPDRHNEARSSSISVTCLMLCCFDSPIISMSNSIRPVDKWHATGERLCFGRWTLHSNKVHCSETTSRAKES